MVTSATEAYPLSDAERLARAALLKRLGVNSAPAIAEVIPINHPARRKPLGLAPGGGSSEPIADEPAAFASDVPSVGAGLSEATLQRPARMSDIVSATDTAIAIGLDGEGVLKARIGELHSEIARLEVENAQLKGALAEVRAKVNELSFVQERLQIERRGPPGHAGPRGADGPRGETGLRGERGEAGRPAPMISAWEVHPDRFEIVPVFSTGERGAPINLLALFQAYHSATQWLEDADLEQAAAASRARAEQDLASHWTKR